MRYLLTHKTQYIYHQSVNICYNEAWLVPRVLPYQRCLSHKIIITPQPTSEAVYEDFFGNQFKYFAIQEPHNQMTVTAITDVEVNRPNPYLWLNDTMTWEEACMQIHQSLQPAYLEARQFTAEAGIVQFAPEVVQYARSSFAPKRPLVQVANDLMERIFSDFKFTAGFTTISTPLAVVLKEKKGVCQDFAHLMIACLRCMGMAARYVSGYIETIPPEGQKKLVGADASHAWCAVFIPNLGWLDFDPTNNQIVHNQYVTTAWGRDYSDVPPLKGVVLGSGTQELKVAVDMLRTKETIVI